MTTTAVVRETTLNSLITSIVLNIGQFISISADIPVFYPKRYKKCKILPDIILNWYEPIYRYFADISTDIGDENIWYIAMLSIWGVFTKGKYPYESMTLNLVYVVSYDLCRQSEFDVRHLVPYHDISPGIRYPVYNFADRYIADIQNLKHWSREIFGEITLSDLGAIMKLG